MNVQKYMKLQQFNLQSRQEHFEDWWYLIIYVLIFLKKYKNICIAYRFAGLYRCTYSKSLPVKDKGPFNLALNTMSEYGMASQKEAGGWFNISDAILPV